MKKAMAILVLVSLLLVCFSACAMDIDNLYPMTAVVTDFDFENDLVIVTDYEGFDWIFEGIEDWQIGDICSMIMFDNNTYEYVEDDIIVKIVYAGFMEN